jgi:hypothetical protein
MSSVKILAITPTLARVVDQVISHLAHLATEWTPEDVIIVAETDEQVNVGILRRLHTRKFLGDIAESLGPDKLLTYETASVPDHIPVLVRAFRIQQPGEGERVEEVGLLFIRFETGEAADDSSN